MLKHKKKAFFLFCLLGLIVNIFIFKRLAPVPYQLSSVSETLSACFSRVTQTNTSKLLNFSSSVHLSEDFFLKTEQCFADTVLLASSAFTGMAKILSSEINLLGSDAHWFFEKISKGNGPSTFATSGPSYQSSREDFSKLEKSYFTILEDIENEKLAVKDKQDLIQLVLYINIVLICLCVVVGIISFACYLKQRNLLETQADSKMKENLVSEKGQEILTLALDFADLPKCKDLLIEWGARSSGVSLQKTGNVEKVERQEMKEVLNDCDEEHLHKIPDLNIKGNNLHTPQVIVASKEEREEKLEVAMYDENQRDKREVASFTLPSVAIKNNVSANATSFEPNNVLPMRKLYVAEVLSSIIEQLSIKFFTQGVKLEINIAEESTLSWEREAFEYIVHDLIAKTLELHPSHIFLSFYQKKKSHALSVAFNSAQTYNLSFMKEYYELVDTLIKEFGGKASYPSLHSEKTVIELDFGLSQASSYRKKTRSFRELVSFRRATKKELRAEFYN